MKNMEIRDRKLNLKKPGKVKEKIQRELVMIREIARS